MMIDDVINLFPPHTHPLTLVSDPDRFLSSERVMSEFAQRDFQVIQEDDPVFLRHRIEEARPFSREHPAIIITTSALENMSYDIYQPAYRLSFSLHQYFPNLAYPVLQTLNPDQIEKLSSCPPPVETLSRQKTIDYLLREVFDADPITLSQPHALIAWLNDYHHNPSLLPELLRSSLVESLKRYPMYQEWDINLLIRDAQTFADFIQQQWRVSIEQSLSGKQIKETTAGYHVSFDRNPQLQDLVPGLVRRGTIQPLEITDKKSLPNWAHPGVTLVDTRLQRFTSLLEDMGNRLNTMKSNPQVQTSWNIWNEIAQDWAELCSYYTQTDLTIDQTQKETFRRLIRETDPLFITWLKSNYAPLGTQRLPKPHHVYHVPHYLAYLRNLGQIERVVLLVLDGLSLTDWLVIKSLWEKRHANWKMKTETILAQVPTITSISRYALISGLRPADFAFNMDHSVSEARAWELFWSREGIAEATCKLLPLSYDRQIDQQPELQDPLVNFWCLIDDTPDKLAHNATLGAANQQSSLLLWLDPAQDQNSIPLEKLINSYLERGYSVFIASDHGHVEATGFGQPSEGLLAQTRGKRARIYMDRLAALRVQSAFADTILWGDDGILPDQMVALMPAGRDAFTHNGEVVVTHGGISIEEVIVPLIQITKVSS
ncbi:MAG: BREX-3 system phosphatase PglZ [Anaerolineaceae bacterium]